MIARPALLSLILTGCRHTVPPPPPPPLVVEAPAPAPDPYAEGVADAMHPLPSEADPGALLVLTPAQAGLRWDEAGRVLVTTWSRSQYYDPEVYVPGHAFDLYGETWFTTGAEVADTCAGLEGAALSERVEQYLGLPTGGGRDVFLQVWIDPADLIRPCADPDVTTSAGCVVDAPMQAGEDGASVWWACGSGTELSAHQRWMCLTWVDRYSASDPSAQYPWTALGYTYDWGSPEDPVGASEFVAPGGAAVVLEAMHSNAAFCGGE